MCTDPELIDRTTSADRAFGLSTLLYHSAIATRIHLLVLAFTAAPQLCVTLS
jgi:hypothetical protein